MVRAWPFNFSTFQLFNLSGAAQTAAAFQLFNLSTAAQTAAQGAAESNHIPPSIYSKTVADPFVPIYYNLRRSVYQYPSLSKNVIIIRQAMPMISTQRTTLARIGCSFLSGMKRPAFISRTESR